MKQKLREELTASMKAGDKLRTMTLRGVFSEITRVEKDTRREANETEIVQVLKRERAKREEALEFARKAKREDLIVQYEGEAKILDGYLPAAASADEIKAAVAEQLSNGINQIGPLMKALREQFGARLDNRLASQLVKQALAQR